MKDKYLPIGTVVLLKDATKKLMITGYYSMLPDDQTKVYDYVGCLFPEGNMAGDEVALFDHSQIATISYMGLVNDEYNKFNNELINAVNEKESLIEEKVPEEEPFVPLSFSEAYEVIKKLPIENLKKQVSIPTPFDMENRRIPSFDIMPVKEKTITAIRPSIGEQKEEVVATLDSDNSDDEGPVLHLEPIMVENNIKNDVASNNTGKIFDLERL